MAEQYPPKLIELVSASVVEFFQSIGISDISAQDPEACKPSNSKGYSASLGFTGDHIKGALVVVGDEDLLKDTNPQKDFGKPLTEADSADWIGEIANQIVGALKRHTLGYNVGFMLSTPTVVSGHSLDLIKTQKPEPLILCFKVAEHMVHINFRATLSAEAKFEGDPQKTEQAAGGDALFF